MNDEYKSRLIELRKTHTVSEIAKLLNKPERTVSRHLKSFGLTKSLDRCDIQDDDILKAWSDGFTINEIAKKFSCSHDTVTKRLSKHGISCDRKTGIRKHFDRVHDELWADMKSDLDNRMSVSAVSVKYKMRFDNVLRLMKKHDYAVKCENCIEKLYERMETADTTEFKYISAILEHCCIYGQVPSIAGLASNMKLSVSAVYQYIKRYNLSEFVLAKTMSSYVSRIVCDLDKLGIKYETDNRHILLYTDGRYREIDVYLPDYKLGIEVNPVGTHSFDTKPYGITDTAYHQRKSLAAEKAGIGLLHMYDSDFIDERKYKVFLRQIEARTKNKIKFGARQCVVKEILHSVSNEFLNKFHFQGSENVSSYVYGLYFDDILVGILTLGKSRYTSDDYEIIRYCINPDYIISGAFGKLFSHFLDRVNRGVTIVSYMDLNKRFTSSNVYEKNGFVLSDITQPDYVWVNEYGTDTLKRYQTTKKRLIAQGFDEKLTEIDIMKSRGYYRVFGAGSKRYVYKYE